MSEESDMRLILPFLNNRLNGPVYVSFIAIAELGGAALFVVYALRIVYMVRNMAIAEEKELRDRKMNELMENIASLEREIKEKKEKKKKRKLKDKKINDDSEKDKNGDTEGNSSKEHEKETNDDSEKDENGDTEGNSSKQHEEKTND